MEAPRIPTYAYKEGHSTQLIVKLLKKTSLSIVVLRLSYNPSTIKYRSFQYPQCLVQKTAKTVVYIHFCVFSVKLLGHHNHQDERYFHLQICQSRQRTEIIRGGFAFFPTAWDMGAFTTRKTWGFYPPRHRYALRFPCHPLLSLTKILPHAMSHILFVPPHLDPMQSLSPLQHSLQLCHAITCHATLSSILPTIYFVIPIHFLSIPYHQRLSVKFSPWILRLVYMFVLES